MTNGGPVGNGVKVAGSVVDALKQQPILLALVIFNALFIAVVYFAGMDNRKRQAEMVEHLLANQTKMQEMLVRCGSRTEAPGGGVTDGAGIDR